MIHPGCAIASDICTDTFASRVIQIRDLQNHFLLVPVPIPVLIKFFFGPGPGRFFSGPGLGPWEGLCFQI